MGLSQADLDRLSRLFDLYKEGVISREELETSKEAIQAGMRPNTGILRLAEISTKRPTVELDAEDKLLQETRENLEPVAIVGKMSKDTSHFYRNSQLYYKNSPGSVWNRGTAVSWFAAACLVSFFLTLGLPSLFGG